MGIAISDLGDVEVKEGGGGELLPNGRHTVRITDATEDRAQSGNPQIVVTLTCIEGEHEGKTIRDWLTVTPAALWKIKKFLTGIAYPIPAGDFDLQPASLIGRPCRVSVRPRRDAPDKSEIAFYDPAPEVAFEEPAPAAASPAQASVEVPF